MQLTSQLQIVVYRSLYHYFKCPFCCPQEFTKSLPGRSAHQERREEELDIISLSGASSATSRSDRHGPLVVNCVAELISGQSANPSSTCLSVCLTDCLRLSLSIGALLLLWPPLLELPFCLPDSQQSPSLQCSRVSFASSRTLCTQIQST